MFTLSLLFILPLFTVKALHIAIINIDGFKLRVCFDKMFLLFPVLFKCPEGQESWSIQDFTSISPRTNFKFFDAFTDKDENINTELPGADWDLNFSEHNGTTTVSITIQYKTLSDLEQIIQMGFKEGFTMTLNDLEKLLATLSQRQ